MTAQSGEPARTGHGRVDEAIVRLRELDGAPVGAHVDVYEAVHEELRAALTAAGAEGASDDTGAAQDVP